MNDDRTLRAVVFPVPVPPLTMTFSRPLTQASRNLAVSGEKLPKLIRSWTVNGSLANFRIVRNGPTMARGGRTALTRVDHRRRLVDPAADLGHDLLDDPAEMSLVGEGGAGAGELAGPLHVDAIRPVHHDLGDVGVLEEPVDRAVAEDVVGDVLEELGPVRARQRDALPAEDDLQLLLQLAGELLLPDAPVVEQRAELVDEEVVHAPTQLVEERVAARPGRRVGRGLVQPLIEGHVR